MNLTSVQEKLSAYLNDIFEFPRIFDRSEDVQIFALRAIVGLYIIWSFVLSDVWTLMATLDLHQVETRNILFRYLMPHVVSNLELFKTVALVSGLLFSLSIVPRISGILFLFTFVCLVFLFTILTSSFGLWPLFWFYILALSLNPLGIQHFAKLPDPDRSKNNRFTLRVLVVWYVIFYFGAGVAKIAPFDKGIMWLQGYTIQHLIVSRVHDSPIFWMLGKPLFDYSISWPFQFGAAMGVFLELSAIGMLLFRNYYKLMVPLILSFHFMLFMFGVPSSLHYLVAASIFINYNSIRLAITRKT